MLSKLLPIISLFFILTAFKTENRHPLHVSTTEISYNNKSKSLEITCKIFSDDFENALTKRFKTKINLQDKKLQQEMNILIKSYLEANLKFTVNGKISKANYLGAENDHEATNLFLEIENISALQSLTVSNSILYDLFDDQMNILHVEKNGARKSTKANYPEKVMSVSF